ncbi:MAG: AMP-binding protein [Spirochaetales bacterium]|uniref:AMP-binding protein n=1 Tax=Candidatus Thalassospirochaeta sargassi TaxID=3119039 RepID=A0AAJ1IG94_9SPIO|nr:AMP-binding protein [Spirochaetales bacterium]
MELIEKTLGGLLEEQTAAFPDKEFIVYSDRNLRFTYSQFNERVDRLAKGLIAIGIGKDSKVGIWATNVPDWCTFMFATAKIGAILVTVNIEYKSHELEYLVKQADLDTLCIIDGYKDSDYVQIVNDLLPELKTSQRGELKAEKFPELRNLIFIGQEKHRGMYNTQELLLLGQHIDDADLRIAFEACDCQDVVNMQYTSGTTGFPKGVMLTHYNILNNGYNIGECQKFTEKDVLCLPVPLFHCFGIVLGVMAILTHGGSMAIVEKFDPLVVMASVQKEKCTALYGVPTMFIAELNHPMFDIFDFSSLRTGIMAGSPCPMETMKQVIEKMNMADVTIAYGLTEASPVMTQTVTDDPIEKRVSTVGRELHGIEVKVLNPETGEECEVEEQGELCCRGYNSMKGYYKNPEATAACIDKNGWLHSGDLGIKDVDGYFRVTGRIKDMIIRGGENIYPREIEEFLYTLPEIKDIQVAGVPDEKFGEQVGAFIILHDGKTLRSEDVKDFCRGKISRHKIPKYVFFVDGYPLTASGKIQKYKIGEIALELIKDGQG